MSEGKPREKLALHMSVNGQQARKNYSSFLQLMEWAIKSAPSEIRFTCPEVEALQPQLAERDAAITELKIFIRKWLAFEQGCIDKHGPYIDTRIPNLMNEAQAILKEVLK